jgi:hypothetical protein
METGRPRRPAAAREPSIVIDGVGVALAAVAGQGDDGSALILGAHSRRQGQNADQIGPGGGAEAAAGPFRQPADGGHRGGVGNLHHAVHHLGHERRLDARPSDPLGDAGTAVRRRRLARKGWEEGRTRRVDDTESRPGEIRTIADIAADRGARPSRARAHDDPGRQGEALPAHLGEQALGDIVVAAPVGGAFGVGELIHEVAAQLDRQGAGEIAGVFARLGEPQFPPGRLDGGQLGRGGGGGNHGDEGQPHQSGEEGFGDGGRARRGLDHGHAFAKIAVADGVQEQRSREAMLEAAAGMDGLVLQIDVDIGKFGQVEADQVRVRRALQIGLDGHDRLANPGAVRGVSEGGGGGVRHARGPWPALRRDVQGAHHRCRAIAVKLATAARGARSLTLPPV